MSILKSRETFIKEVAETIKKNHGQNPDESFIFGISGKWGEGKTIFLDGLETELQNEFTIIRGLNPWKFAHERVSFLRKFISEFKELKTKKNIPNTLHWVQKFLKNENDNSLLNSDISTNQLHHGWLLFFITLWLILFWFVIFRTKQITNLNTHTKWIISVIAIPIIAAITSKMIISQKTDHAISTLDRFESLLQDLIKKNKEKKILVFIDDLDRVTPLVAKETLDNLRTFFDKKELTFVVTGDHTVLERFLGKDLLPDSNNIREQEEEGRRFMKKIFNVYWRLPLPIESELEEFLNSLFKDRKDDLNNIFPKDKRESKKKLRDILKRHFERNFRNIIRFFDYCVFTFNIIKITENNEDLKKYPLLVIRILMIQELCSPLFDAILKDYQLLLSLEYAVDKKDITAISALLTPLGLTPDQTAFINDFLYQEDRFYINSSLVVPDLIPFLFLASDSGAPDQRGPSPEDFITMLGRGNPNEVSQVIIATGEKKLKEASAQFTKVVNQSENPQKNNYFLSLLKSLVIIPKDHISNEIFFEAIDDIELSFTTSLDIGIKYDIYISFTLWLDHFLSHSWDVSRYFGVISSIYPENLNVFQTSESKFGYFSTTFFIRWFKEHFLRDKNQSLQIFESLLSNERLDDVAIKTEAVSLAELRQSLLDYIIIDPAASSKAFATKLLKNYFANGEVDLINNIKSSIGNLNEQAWNSGIECINTGETSLSQKDLEDVIIELLREMPEGFTLEQVLGFSKNKIYQDLPALWDTIVKKHIDVFIEYAPAIINDSSFTSIAPDPASAKLIFKSILNKIKEVGGASGLSYLELLDSTKWLWFNLGAIDARGLSGLTRATETHISDRAKQIKEGWKMRKNIDIQA